MANDIFVFRQSLIGHQKDVRSVSVGRNGEILTTSRDLTSKLWNLNENNRSVYEEKLTFTGHSGYVSSSCFIHKDGVNICEDLVVTGSKDCSILVFSTLDGKIQNTLKAHADTVSCLVWSSGYLISGSWDKTSIIWSSWKCFHHLKGHEGPIWAVAVLSCMSNQVPQVLTASADKTIKLWIGEKDVITYKGHTDCVRGLAVRDDVSFLSCSNDSSIRLWNINGSCISTFYGHTNFIYSISLLSRETGFVTGGEDRTVRVWDGSGILVQTINIPAQSVWSVASLPNGDIIAGISDHSAYIFSRNTERQAPQAEVEAFEASVAKATIAVDDIGGLKKSDLPTKEALCSPGKKDGQTLMVCEGDKVFCHSWSASKSQWECVGEVVGGSGGSQGNSGKVLFEGREYDYVFDVDLDEGKVLKLPYNAGEDAYSVAQKFIHHHELPQDYLDQVAQFVIKNTGGSAMHMFPSQGYHDPFTGQSRYVPGMGSACSGPSSGSDPFTGGGRYLPSVSNGVSDSALPQSYFPQLVPLSFDSCNVQGISSKLRESNLAMGDHLSPEEVESLISAISGMHDRNVDPKLLAPLNKALTWPPEHVWPALDILRLSLRVASLQESWLGDKETALFALLLSFVSKSVPVNTQLLSLRCLVNLATCLPGQAVLFKHVTRVITASSEIAPYPNKNVEIAAATLILNCSVIFVRRGNNEDGCQIVSGCGTLLLSCSDGEAIFRALVALGTVLSASKSSIDICRTLDIKSVVVSVLERMEHSSKTKECANSVLTLLS